MLVLLSAAYAVGIGGGEVARKLDLRPSQIVPAADTLPVRNLIYLIGDGMGLSHGRSIEFEGRYSRPVPAFAMQPFLNPLLGEGLGRCAFREVL